MESAAKLTIGTRGSPLALAQTELVRAALAAAHAELAEPDAVHVRIMRTSGDRFVDRPLAEIGGKGLFTKEIEEALLQGTIDLAVHSLKDMPTELPEGLVLAACLPRADPRDALIGVRGGIAALPAGALVGTASLRRAAQLLHRRPDLRVTTLRGNVQTRIAKVRRGEVAATFLAAAGLARLEMLDAADCLLPPEEMLPAVGQGAICVEARAGDTATLDFLAAINHFETEWQVGAERIFLAELDGSCRTPIAALCERDGEFARFRGLVAAPDGSRVFRAECRGSPEDMEELAREAGARLREAAGSAIP